MDSHIPLTLYLEYIELFHCFMRVILPSKEFKMKILFILNKGGTNSGVIDNLMGIIHKYMKGENTPEVRGEINPSPLFSTGAGKELYQSSRLAHRIRNKVQEKYQLLLGGISPILQLPEMLRMYTTYIRHNNHKLLGAPMKVNM